MAQYPAAITRLSQADDGKRNGPIQVSVQHTNEPGPYARGKNPSDAKGMLDYCFPKANGASYHTITDREGITGRCNDDDYIPWAAGQTANRKGLHNCATGWSKQSREEWLSFPKQIDELARVHAFNCREHGLPAAKISGADIRAGRKGICGHADTSQGWGETNHSDPGDFFPWDVLVNKVKILLGQTAVPAIPSWGGAIREHYDKNPALAKVLGAPNPALEFTTPDGVGRYTHFQNGSIYWTPNTGAFAVYGGIRDAWQKNGWEKGPLGYPVSDEFAAPWGRQTNFEHGFITWTDNKAHVFH